MTAGDTEDTVGDPMATGDEPGGTATPTRKQPSTAPGRPLSVAATAILYALSGIFGIVGGIAFIVGGGLFGTFLPGEVGGFLAAIGAIIGVFILVIGLSGILIAWGIWTGREWGRAIAVVFSGIGLVFGAIAVLGAASGDPGGLLGTLPFAAFHGAVVYFFTRDYVAEWFHAMPG